MRYARYMVAVLFALVFIPVALAQDEVIVLTDEELGPHERPPVKFGHERHQEVVTECRRCHHDYDKYMTNIGGEGQACSECHDRSNGKSALSLVRAFHMQCKECHKGLLARGQKSGPIMCGRCHQR